MAVISNTCLGLFHSSTYSFFECALYKPRLHGHSDPDPDPDWLRLHGGKLDSNPDSDHLSHVDCDPDSNPDSGPGARVNMAIDILQQI